MKKIRIGNDFVLVWIITRGGQPEDLSNIIDASLNVRVFTKVKTVPFEITGNSLRIEFTPEICDTLGVYNLVFSYELPDSGLADWQRKCTIDVNAFQIVPTSMMADDITEFSVTSDLLIGFKGDPGKSAYEIWLEAGNIGTIDDYLASLKGEPFTFEDFTPEQLALLKGEKGDPFTFEDFTPEQLALLKGEKGDSPYQLWINDGHEGTVEDYLEWLRQPSIDAGTTVQEQTNLFISEKTEEIDNVVGEIAYNESKRLEAEALRVSAESTRVENENARIEAEALRVEAETARQENTAIAIQNANEAASNANEARLSIEGDLTTINDNISDLSNGVIDDEEVIATDLNELSARVSALEAAFRNMIISKMQIDSIDVLKDLNYQGRPLFIVSNVAPNIEPDGVPQFWINTSNGDLYSAQNVNSVASWKLK